MVSSLSSIYSDQYSGNIGVTITQALLKGFGLGANLAAIRSARLDVAMSRAELKAVVEEMVAQIENAYWDLYLTRQETGIQRQSLELANQQLRESLERVQVGKLPQLELAAVHAELAQRQEACLDAQSRYLQAQLRCIFLLNHPDSSGWSLIPIPLDRPFFPTDTLDQVGVHEQLGLKYRADLQQARWALEKGDLEIRRTKNGLLPQLDLFITLGRTTYSKSFRAAAPDPHSPFYDINGGINFQFPVLDQQARAQFHRAQYSREQLTLALRNLERLVQWDVRAAHIEVLRSRQQIEATRVTRELQDQKLAAELEKFRVGKSTNYLVLQAQRDFTASQLDEARSMVAYLNALVNLYLMEGTLLDRRHLSLDAAF
jgi:outer membrane protein TolC